MYAKHWTEDLPKCERTTVAQCLPRNEAYVSSDDSLYISCQLEDDTCLYGVFEPQNGMEAVRFILPRMAAEILFSQFGNKSSDEDLRELLRNAFLSVEKAYVESIDGLLAERTSLQFQLQSVQGDEQRSSAILCRLQALDRQLSSGASCALAMVRGGALVVGSLGGARVLLARADPHAALLRVLQLSADHAPHNDDELLRLSQLGLDVNRIRNAQYLGNQQNTRCLGNYLVKGLYKAFPDLSSASSEPVISVPEIYGPIHLDESCRFLVLVSSGVYKRLQEIRGNSEQTNRQIAQIIVENFRKQPNFTDVSRAVLQEIVDEYANHFSKRQMNIKYDENMTLLIRNFNFPVQNMPVKMIAPKTVDSKPEEVSKFNEKPARPQSVSVRFNPVVQSKSNTFINEMSDVDSYTPATNTSEIIRTQSSIDSNNRTINSDCSSDIYPPGKLYDRNRKIKSYVDFSAFYDNVETAKRQGSLPSFINFDV